MYTILIRLIEVCIKVVAFLYPIKIISSSLSRQDANTIALESMLLGVSRQVNRVPRPFTFDNFYVGSRDILHYSQADKAYYVIRLD